MRLAAPLQSCHGSFRCGERLEHILRWTYFGSDPVGWAGWNAALVVSAWSTVALEIVLGLGLLFTRTPSTA